MNLEVLYAVLGSLGAIVSLISFLYFRKQSKRLKTAEAFEKEVEALKSTIQELKQQVNWDSDRIKQLQEMYNEKDAFLHIVTKEKHTIEVKHYRNKEAIACANHCRFNPDASKCPVVIRKTANDKQYLNELKSDGTNS